MHGTCLSRFLVKPRGNTGRLASPDRGWHCDRHAAAGVVDHLGRSASTSGGLQWPWRLSENARYVVRDSPTRSFPAPRRVCRQIPEGCLHLL